MSKFDIRANNFKFASLFLKICKIKDFLKNIVAMSKKSTIFAN